MVDLGKSAGSAGDDDGVKAEEKAAQCGDYGAFQEISVHGLADARSAWHGIPRRWGCQTESNNRVKPGLRLRAGRQTTEPDRLSHRVKRADLLLLSVIYPA